MIIGYYGQSFFGGGNYIKLSKKENEEYIIEHVKSVVPNFIFGAEKSIKEYDSIQKFNDCIKDNVFDLINVKILENSLIVEFVEYIKTLDLEKIAKKKYRDDGILDGLCWEVFIEIEGKKYSIEGYEAMPKEIGRIIKFLEKIANEANEIKLKTN